MADSWVVRGASDDVIPETTSAVFGLNRKIDNLHCFPAIETENCFASSLTVFSVAGFNTASPKG